MTYLSEITLLSNQFIDCNHNRYLTKSNRKLDRQTQITETFVIFNDLKMLNSSKKIKYNPKIKNCIIKKNKENSIIVKKIRIMIEIF